MQNFVQIAGTQNLDAYPSIIVNLGLDNLRQQKLVFNVGEGLYRLFNSIDFGAKYITNFLYTSLEPRAFGGQFGLALSFNENGVKYGIYGPEGTSALFASLELLVEKSFSNIPITELSKEVRPVINFPEAQIYPIFLTDLQHLPNQAYFPIESQIEDLNSLNQQISSKLLDAFTEYKTLSPHLEKTDDQSKFAHTQQSLNSKVSRQIISKFLEQATNDRNFTNCGEPRPLSMNCGEYRLLKPKQRNTICYLVDVKSIPRQINYRKIQNLNITEDMFKLLEKGQDAIYEDGTVIKSEEVISEQQSFPCVFIVDCQDINYFQEIEQYASTLLQEKVINSPDRAYLAVKCFVFHISSARVVREERYQRWMQRFGQEVNIQHVFLNDLCNRTIQQFQQAKTNNSLSEIDNVLFPLLQPFEKQIGALRRKGFIVTNDPQVQISFAEIDQQTEKQSDMEKDSESDIKQQSREEDNTNEQVLLGEVGMIFNLSGLSRFKEIQSQKQLIRDNSKIEKEISSQDQNLKGTNSGASFENQEINRIEPTFQLILRGVITPMMSIAKTNEIPSEQFKQFVNQRKSQLIRKGETIHKNIIGDIVMLGCGAAIPNQYRNVSSILIDFYSRNINQSNQAISKDSNQHTASLLMDCGEGTLGQLMRHFSSFGMNRQQREDGILSIETIFITHAHPDHILGLWNLLSERERIIRERFNTPSISPVTIIGPWKMHAFLRYLSLIWPISYTFIWFMNIMPQYPLNAGSQEKKQEKEKEKFIQIENDEEDHEYVFINRQFEQMKLRKNQFQENEIDQQQKDKQTQNSQKERLIHPYILPRELLYPAFIPKPLQPFVLTDSLRNFITNIIMPKHNISRIVFPYTEHSIVGSAGIVVDFIIPNINIEESINDQAEDEQLKIGTKESKLPPQNEIVKDIDPKSHKQNCSYFRLSYSGDTLPTVYFTSEATKCHILIHECTQTDEYESYSFYRHHSTLSQNLLMAEAIKPQLLILTHLIGFFPQNLTTEKIAKRLEAKKKWMIKENLSQGWTMEYRLMKELMEKLDLYLLEENDKKLFQKPQKKISSIIQQKDNQIMGNSQFRYIPSSISSSSKSINTSSSSSSSSLMSQESSRNSRQINHDCFVGTDIGHHIDVMLGLDFLSIPLLHSTNDQGIIYENEQIVLREAEIYKPELTGSFLGLLDICALLYQKNKQIW